LTQGPSIERFEDAVAKYVGAKFAVAYSSGTSALHGAAAAAGLGPGDLVATSPLTFMASANAARYFFNAGGRIKWETNKSSTGQLADAEWNDLATTLCGDIYITGGGVLSPQTIAGTSYTGTTKIGGTGTPNTLATSTGWYNLLTTDTQLYRQFADTAPYTGQYISLNAKTAGTGTQLVLTTTWVDPGGSGIGSSDVISGGTATGSPFTAFGTAPATVVTLFLPSATYLTSAAWGTPTIAASVA
jgi:hypothetical protein